MNGHRAVNLVPFLVAGFLFVGVMALVARHTTRHLPSHIARQLLRSGKPVTFAIRGTDLPAWDPSGSIGDMGLWTRGTATYSLDSPTVVRLRLTARDGTITERSGEVPSWWLPDPPEIRHRKRVARALIWFYTAIAGIAFALPVWLVDDSPTVRIRIGCLSSVCAVTIGWLVAHIVMTHRRMRATHTLGVRLRHIAIWTGGLLIISAALAVAWRLGDNGQPRQTTTSWPSAFINALIFVFSCAAAIAASTHHHAFVHHTARRDQEGSNTSGAEPKALPNPQRTTRRTG